MVQKSQLGLRGKVTLVLAFMLIISLLVTSMLSYLQSQHVAERKVIELEKSQLEVLKHEIQGSLQGHQNILMSLRDVPPIQAILRARVANGIDPKSGDSLEEWQKRLQTIFLAFVANHNQYLQIRYIDYKGNEMVRVQVNDAGDAEAVSNALLQNKAQELYVSKTINLLNDQVYFSNVTLNREHGVIQMPHQPVLRIAVPVYLEGSQHQAKGLIVINLATKALFSDIQLNNGGISQFVVDENGNYLIHSQQEKTFAQDKGLNHNFRNEFSQLASLSKKHDQLIRRFDNQENIVGFEKIYFSPFDKKRYWLIVLQVPESVVFSDIQESLNKMLVVGLLIGILTLILVMWFVSQRILNPILNLAEAAERIQEGDLTLRLDRLTA